MHPRPPIRLLLCLALCGLSPCLAQLPATGQPKPSAAIPATEPTAAPPVPAVPLTPAQRSPHYANVTWQGGKLAIEADNSSLNQILREVSRLTGMKITGGVVDERVFGSYGPGDPSTILDTLLDGTGSNMLLMQSDNDAPAELVLTPRHGGPTPPSPNALPHDAREDREAEDIPPQQIHPMIHPPPIRKDGPAAVPAGAAVASTPPTVLVPAANVPAANVPPAAAPAAADPAPAPTSDATTTQQSPNGVKTPQQIYEQLLKMQQKTTSQ